MNLLIERTTSVSLRNIILKPILMKKVNDLLSEYSKRDTFKPYNLAPVRKLLFWGPPGTGKTMLASVLAHELGLKLYMVEFSQLVSMYQGETEKKISEVFMQMQNEKGVYLFDEIDAISSSRETISQNHGRREVNYLLTRLENDPSDSLIIGTTNFAKIIDKAMLRRFDDIIEFEKPGVEEIRQIILNHFAFLRVKTQEQNDMFKKSARDAVGMNAHDICKVCEQAAKAMILEGRCLVKWIELIHLIKTFQKENTLT